MKRITLLLGLMPAHMPHPLGIIGLALGVMGVTATSQVLEDHTLRLPTVFAVGSVVVGGAWQLSRRFQRFEDHFTEIDRKLDELWCIRHPERTRPTEPIEPKDKT